jgi:hypothetical protein
MSSVPNVVGHAWWPENDYTTQTHIWRCTCGEVVYQPFEAPVPCEIIGHPQDHGQLRGWDIPNPR